MKNANRFSKANKLHWLTACAGILLLTSFQQQPVSIWQMRLRDSQGRLFTLSQMGHNKASVLVFVSPECPLCQSYALTLRQLQQQFASHSIRFYGVVPDKGFTNQQVNAYRKTYQVYMPMLRDDEQKLTRMLGATVTPEVFVLNPSGQIIYSGRIDNWAYELGKKRSVITEHDLRDALQAMVKNVPVSHKRTKAIGCFIE
jgi:thiol-disulfide isomerase/thioredoxin